MCVSRVLGGPSVGQSRLVTGWDKPTATLSLEAPLDGGPPFVPALPFCPLPAARLPLPDATPLPLPCPLPVPLPLPYPLPFPLPAHCSAALVLLVPLPALSFHCVPAFLPLPFRGRLTAVPLSPLNFVPGESVIAI